MLKHFAREWRLVRASRPYWCTVLILATLTGLALRFGWTHADDRRRLSARFERESSENHLLLTEAVKDLREVKPTAILNHLEMNEPTVDPERLLGHKLGVVDRGRIRAFWNFGKSPEGMTYYLPWRTWASPSTLDRISVGESDYWPSHYHLTYSSDAKTLNTPRLANPLLSRIGVFDLATLITILMPLVILIVLHDIVPADRERGTLWLTTAQSARYPRVVLARLILRLAGVLLAVLGVTIAGLALSGVNLADPHSLAMVAAFSGLVAAYATFWASLAWWGNSWGMTSVTTAVLLFAAWATIVVGIPALVTTYALEQRPVSPMDTLIEAELDFKKGIDAKYAQSKREARLADAKLGERRGFGKNQREVYRQASEEQRAGGRQIVASYFDQYKAQHRETLRWEPTSPALVLKNRLDMLAGNHFVQHVSLAEETHRFLDRFRNFFGETRDQDGRVKPLRPDDVRDMPRFEPLAADRGLGTGHLSTGIAVILAWSSVPAVLGWVRLKAQFE